MSDNNLNNSESSRKNYNANVCNCEEKTANRNRNTQCRENRPESDRQPRNQTCSCTEKREQILKEAEASCGRSDISEADLQEVYKNACTGKESVEILKSFSSNKGFRNLLIRQYKEYSSIAKEIELYANQLGYSLEKTSVFAKGMMYMTTAINTIKDKSDSKLSEIMMQGINMGIISLTKLNNKLSEENRSCHLADSLLSLLMKNLEEMKLFL